MESLEGSNEYVDENPLFKSCKDLESLREHEDFKELEIQVKHGGIVRAQKIILAARIPFLRKSIKGRFLWDKRDIDIDCATAIISYAYTGKLSITEVNVAKILSISSDLHLEHIVDFCCNFVKPRLNLENLSSFWSLSNNKCISPLKCACLNLMLSKFELFVSTSLFVELNFEDLRTIISSDYLTVFSEESVFGAIETWVQAAPQVSNEEILTDLLKCIRWNQTSREFRRNLSENNNFIQSSPNCLRYLLKVYAEAEGFFDKNERIGANSIFLIGETDAGKKEWLAECYNPAFSRSQILTHLKYRQQAAFVPLADGEVMIVGGIVEGKVSTSVEVFSCREKHAHQVDCLNIARRYHSACAVDKAVIVCGGLNENSNLDSCEVYVKDRWRFLPPMKECRRGSAIVSAPDRRVFIIGGYRGGDHRLSSVEVCQLPVNISDKLPPSADFWRSLAPMQEARNGPAAVLISGNIFAAGGYGRGGEHLSSVEMFSIANDDAVWVSLPNVTSMKEKRAYFSLVHISNEIFALGNDLSPFNSVECLTLSRTGNTEASSSMLPVTTEISTSQWVSLSPITSLKKIHSAVLMPKALI